MTQAPAVTQANRCELDRVCHGVRKRLLCFHSSVNLFAGDGVAGVCAHVEK